jgi:DNA polymerase III delta prime subunit
MATERNPYEQRPEGENVIRMEMQQPSETEATFEVDPETGEITVDLEGSAESIEVEVNMNAGFYENLVEILDDDMLEEIGNTVLDKFEADKDSRAEWESMFERGFDLLGLKLEDTTEPFEGAATAVHPLLIESAVKFQSKASQELFPAKGPVKAQVLGEATLERQQQANRVQNFMNYQVTTQMPEYFDEFERMLFHLPLIGSAVKKVYYDSSLDRPVSEFVPIDQFYVSYYASDLRRADRYTHVIYRSPVDLSRQIEAGMYADMELPDAGVPTLSGMAEKMDTVLGLSPAGDNDPQYVLLEQHCYLELEEDTMHKGKTACPYIVTVEQQSGQVLSIRRNWAEGDDKYVKKMHFTHYRYVPGFGFYGLGLIHFLGNLTMSATAAMRSLLDAGQFANLPGGFKAKGVRMVGDNDPIAPGEFKEVEATGMDLSKSIIPLPFKEPSQTLFNMLSFVTGAGQKFADSTEQVIADSGGYGPVGTTMALLEASSKFFSAIHKRLHKAQGDEFKVLARVNHESLPSEYPYDLPGISEKVFKTDFDGRVDIIPVSDPNIPSNAQRMMLIQMVQQIAQQSDPGMFDMEAINRMLLTTANVPDVDKLMPLKKDVVPLDPMSDIMQVMENKPIKAFPGQNHDAHVQFKMSFLQDPGNQGNPFMAQIGAALQANISEHMLMKYQEQVEGLMDKAIENPQAAAQLAEMADPEAFAQAIAAQQIAETNQMMAQGGPQTPEQQMVQLEAQKLQVEQNKTAAQIAKSQADSALKQRDLDLKEQKIVLDAQSQGMSEQMKAYQKEEDRNSKRVLKAMDVLADLLKAQENNDLEEAKLSAKLLQDVIKQQGIE